MDGLVEPGTMIHCESGRHDFGRYVISDHHPYENLTFKNCFAVSSNIAFAKVGILCGDRLYDTARNFGFGSPTGIPLAGEAAGLLRSPQAWSGRFRGQPRDRIRGAGHASPDGHVLRRGGQ